MPNESMKMVRSFTSESIDQYRDSLRTQGYSPNTISAYTKDVLAFIESVDGIVDEEEFSSLAMAWLQNNRFKISGRTTSRHLASLKSFAKWARVENELHSYRAPTAVKSDPHPLPGGIADVRRMIEAARTEGHVLIIAFCGLAGLRISESLNVRTDSIDRHRMKLVVRGKGDKERRVPISPELWRIVRPRYFKYTAMEDLSPLVGNISDRGARSAVTTVGRRAGIGVSVASHDLRATFATEVYNKTKNARIVQELLGHAQLSTTELYLGISSSAITEAVEL